jgi:hypothetical protein
MELSTLADVRILGEKHLPKEYRSKYTWRHFAGLLERAAEGQQDVAEAGYLGRYCRSPRCRSKLEAPTSSPREAFCARGCHTGFYRTRCRV